MAVTAVTFAAIVVPASATPSPTTISSAFTPNSIGVGDTTALSFTITNPNSSGSLTGIAFTDTLPAGLVVDNPSGTNGTCGSISTLTANPGSSTIALGAGKLAAGASCTVSAAVTSSVPGVEQNSTGPVTSVEGGSGTADTEALTVIGVPTISLLAPVNGATFNFRQKVKAKFSCREAANGPGLTDCEGDAPNGVAIDTSTAGANTFTVTAVSGDGEVVTQIVNYTVRPDNQVTVSHLRRHSGGSVSLDVAVPGRGKLDLLESAPNAVKASAGPRLVPGPGRFVFAQLSRSVGGAKAIRITIKPNALGARTVARLSKNAPKPLSKVVVSLAVEFTPKGGIAHTVSVHGIRLSP